MAKGVTDQPTAEGDGPARKLKLGVRDGVVGDLGKRVAEKVMELGNSPGGPPTRGVDPIGIGGGHDRLHQRG